MKQYKILDKSVAIKRASGRQWVLKPQDLAVALKLVTLGNQWLPYAELGETLRLSQFEAHAAVQRLIASRLFAVIESRPRPVMAAFRPFVIYGAPYSYPPVRIEMTRGFATAHSALPLKEKLVQSDEPPLVWPHAEGDARGLGLLPLYEKLPLAAVDDLEFYELLALFDALRAGQARERNMAQDILEKRLK